MVTLDQLIEIKKQELNILMNMKNTSSVNIQTTKTAPTAKAPTGQFTIEQLAKKLGYKSTTSVYNHMKKLNLSPSSKQVQQVGKDRLFYSQETLDTIKAYKEAQSALVGQIIPM